MVDTVYIAFYEAKKGKLWDRVIGLFSKFSHVEIEVNGICYSSSARDGGFRAKIIPSLHSSGKWQIVELKSRLSLSNFYKVAQELNYKRYDFCVILNFLGLRKDFSKERLWCGEAVSKLYEALYSDNYRIGTLLNLDELYRRITIAENERCHYL